MNLFLFGGVISVTAIRIYKNWDKYDPQSVDEIIRLNIHVD